jgi:hypothetical protein
MGQTKETYAAARARLIREAMALGWQVRTHSNTGRPMATPWIALPRGEECDDVKAYLGKQSIRLTRGAYTRAEKSDLDMRGLAAAELGAHLERQ